ncbi:MAG: YjfB family protein [Gammaproteobacteria bacterium]|nr:YjfB family protein [Gammaproteobacteria bacterium]
MNINSIASGAVAQNVAQNTGDAIGVTVARKALDIQAEAASQLISSATKTAASEPHLGSNVNTHA